jgi:hypothetical protein
MKRCPHCLEEIGVNTKICKHCGKTVSPRKDNYEVEKGGKIVMIFYSIIFYLIILWLMYKSSYVKGSIVDKIFHAFQRSIFPVSMGMWLYFYKSYKENDDKTDNIEVSEVIFYGLLLGIVIAGILILFVQLSIGEP